MGRVFRIACFTVIAVFLAMQFLPGPHATNGTVVADRSIQSSLRMPQREGEILERSCENCHSQTTKWPWYSYVAPFSWQVADDVNRARKAMDLSDWSEQFGRKPQVAASALLAICADMKTRRMPTELYLLTHPEARLSEQDRDQFCQWANGEARRLVHR